MHAVYENIVLRNAEKADCPQLAAWWNDGKIMAHAGFPMGLGTTSEKIAESISSDSDETRRRLILEYENSPIGEMSFRNLGNGEVEIGIKICEFSHQEKGIGRKALSLLIQSLFDMGLKKSFSIPISKTPALSMFTSFWGFKRRASASIPGATRRALISPQWIMN